MKTQSIKFLRINQFIALLLMCALTTTCQAASKTSHANFAYITNQGEDTVSVINNLTNQVIKS